MALNFFRKIVPQPVFTIYHWFFSYLAAYYYKHPSRSMVVIGVVGTNGKSSVVEILSQLLTKLGFKTASLSSLYFSILDDKEKNILKTTMPGRFKLQKFLYQAKNRGAQYAILEITSEGVKQFRHKNIAWDVLIFTNLSPEHIESHGTFEKYKRAKEKVFALLSKTYSKQGVAKVIVVNADDEHKKAFLKHKADKKYLYGLKKELELELGVNDYVRPNAYAFGAEGVGFSIEGRSFKSRLLGEFNLYNLLAAITCVRSFGVPWEKIRAVVPRIEPVPGRMEFVQRKPFAVVVDYAHTPDALQKVYKTLAQISSGPTADFGGRTAKRAGRMICVLGAAGGGRDKWKRPEMGKIAGELCDEIILTNEDPYDEKPEEIIEDIASGFSEIRNTKFAAKGEPRQRREIRKIIDRRKAIATALKMAKQGDVVAITGKGAEPWMSVKHGKKIPWDDREIVREELKNLQK